VVTEDKFIDILATKIMADLDFTVKEEIQKAVAAKKVGRRLAWPRAAAAAAAAAAAGAGTPDCAFVLPLVAAAGVQCLKPGPPARQGAYTFRGVCVGRGQACAGGQT
jgi:hypothetical protein